MSVRVRNILENIKYTEKNIDLDMTKPFSDNIEVIKKELHLEGTKKMVFTINLKNKEKITITDHSKSLKEIGFKPDDDILNVEPPLSSLTIDSTVLITFAYAGPIIVFLLFILFKKASLDAVQILATCLTIFHYLRRIYEVNHVHEYARDTVSVFNIELAGVILYYWVLFGVCIGYFIFRAEKEGPLFSTPVLVALAVLMLLSEYGNYHGHYSLKLLKDANQGKRGIPSGGLFEYVDCPHYFFELCSWFWFSLIINTVTGYLFVVYSLVSMGTIAVKKHKYYREYFKEKYPQGRKAMIPFVF
jgi:very-long-chain enoyl-CoA reductase